MLQFDTQVVLPAVIDRGIGNPGATEFSGECHAGSIKRKCVVDEGDAADRHDSNQNNTCDRKSRSDTVLVVADDTEQGDNEEAEGITIMDAGPCGSRDEKNDVSDREWPEKASFCAMRM